MTEYRMFGYNNYPLCDRIFYGLVEGVTESEMTHELFKIDCEKKTDFDVFVRKCRDLELMLDLFGCIDSCWDFGKLQES